MKLKGPGCKPQKTSGSSHKKQKSSIASVLTADASPEKKSSKIVKESLKNPASK
jgi:hypothetical protein